MCTKAVTQCVVAMSIILAASGLVKPQEAKKPEVPKAAAAPETAVQAVAQLAKQLTLHPVEPNAGADRSALYMMEVASGAETLIADQPNPGLTHCGSPVWSHDGRRIVFDATPGNQWSLTQLRSIALSDGQLSLKDLGPGNCPTLSPADDRIAFLSNLAVEQGVWMMNADGSERRPLGANGRPRWSPNGGQLMIVSFSNPRHVTLMDANPDKSGVLQLPDYQFYADPTWAGAATLVAVIGLTEGDTVALIDVSDPPRAAVKEVLWKRTNGPDVTADFPAFSPATRRAIFVGIKDQVRALYSVEQGKAEPAKRVGRDESETYITDPAFSPDGRYLLYIEHGAHRPHGRRAPGGGDSSKER